METELLNILDARGEIVGAASKAEVRKQNLLHMVSGVLVRNGKGELLVHRRSMAADDNPGKYSLFACAAVREGESYVAAAARVLREQLRIVHGKEEVNILPIFPHNFRSPEANINFGLFLCVHEGPSDPDPRFIGEHFFASVEQIETMLKEKPFLESSVAVLQRYRERVQ